METLQQGLGEAQEGLVLSSLYSPRDGVTGEDLWHRNEGTGTGPVHSELVMERDCLSPMTCNPGLAGLFSFPGSFGGRCGDVLPVPR